MEKVKLLIIGIVFILLTSCSNSNNELYSAIAEGSFSDVEKIIETGVDINYKYKNDRNESEHTALHYAVKYREFDIAKLLIEKGADVNAINIYGWHPLLHAVNDSNFALTELLLQNGADIKHENPETGSSCIHYAIGNDDLKIVKLLLKYGANIYAVDYAKQTALFCAKEKTEIFYLMINYGQDTIIPTEYFLPEKFSKPINWEKAENITVLNEQFYCSDDTLNIKNHTEAFNIIDTTKDFCNLYYACKWCKNNPKIVFPQLIKRLTNTTEVGLNPYVDLTISKRSADSSMPYIRSTGGKPGILINEDIFTISGRASWILNEITGENFAIVNPFTSKEKLEQYQQNWIDWIKKIN